jgi:choline dehydrogenase-like flavoprotein
VADASIMPDRDKSRIEDALWPDIVSGNTNAPTIMIGEKASDFIREYCAHQYVVCNPLERY